MGDLIRANFFNIKKRIPPHANDASGAMIKSAIPNIDAPPPAYSEHPTVESDDSTTRTPAAAPMAENECLVKRNMSTMIIDGAKKNNVQDVSGASGAGLQSYS